MNKNHEKLYPDLPLTATFPPEILPVRSGAYFTREIDLETGKPLTEGFFFSHFDATDRIWGCSAFNRDVATNEPNYEFASQSKEWIGLAQEPKP